MEQAKVDLHAHTPPIQEVFDAFCGDRLVGLVSLSLDPQVWIAGIILDSGQSHLGSFATVEEARQAVETHLQPRVVEWRSGDFDAKRS